MGGMDKWMGPYKDEKVRRASFVPNIPTSLPSKWKHSLNRYLAIFLVMITLLSITLLVLCSQATLPGRSNHPSLFKPTPLTQDNLLQLQNGNLIHYVGDKFMAPATEQKISQHLHNQHVNNWRRRNLLKQVLWAPRPIWVDWASIGQLWCLINLNP